MTRKKEFAVSIDRIIWVEAENEEEALKTAKTVIRDHMETVEIGDLSVIDMAEKGGD